MQRYLKPRVFADCHCVAESSRYQLIGDFYNMELFDTVVGFSSCVTAVESRLHVGRLVLFVPTTGYGLDDLSTCFPFARSISADLSLATASKPCLVSQRNLLKPRH
jgi:hypothetical protein